MRLFLSALVHALILAALVPFVATASADEVKPIRALLVIGGCCHDYAHQQKLLPEGISARANVEWTVVHEGDGSTTHKMSVYNNPDWSKDFDVVVHDECCADVKDQAFVEGILKPHRAGLPAVNLHCAMHCYRVSFENFKDWFEFTGLDTRAHGAQEPIALDFRDIQHPITQGMKNWTTIPEELYNNIKVYDTVTPLIYGRQGKDNNVVAWVNNYHGTRVFSTTLGHNNETVNDPRYLDLVTRGLLWAVNKLNADYLKPAARVYSPVAANAKKTLEPVNLALHKPASASASQDGHAPEDAVDGDSETRWCAPDNGDNYWWQVDLRKPQAITGCKIVWEQEDRPYQYTVTGSADGQAWKTLAQENGASARPQEDTHKFSADGVRYVRVTVTKAPSGSWASFFEVEVFGKELAEKSASAQVDRRLAEVKVPEGFERTIFAAPPDISYPTCIAAEPTGEVFVGVDQNGSLDVSRGRGWVVRCIDTDGDGVADKFNIFAKMDSPRGIVFDHNVLYVMHPPVLEAFYDDTGSGVANRSEVLVRGLGHDLNFRGADHTCNGVRMGIDGWLYIALGDYGALKAVGKDGTEIQVHGGGIVRVRPDGTDLEIVVQGTRNIYDVAIDPFMDIFTCDNTNDGDDWNVRLSHMIPTANYGYPSLFRHFSDEMIPTMADYGGGAPTGSIFLDEPGFPNGLGHGLYTCQWGWNTVTRHPLKNAGGSFEAQRAPFISLTRPTGIDEDGEGHLYIASWKGATFNYAGPNVGYIARVTPSGNKPLPFPNLQKSTAAQLLEYLTSPSAVWRLRVQREILHRGSDAGTAKGLEKLAMTHANAAVRAAAIFTLNQMLGAEAHTPLMQIAKDDSMRQYAIKAIADRKKDAANVPTSYFVSALADKNPAVRLEALIALNRLGRKEAAEALLPLTTDADPSVAHVAFRALVSFHAGELCLKAFDQSQTALFPGAARVLRNLHDADVVDGLVTRLDKMPASAPAFRPLSTALCRLYYREADWDGSWWGTRPDTSGPYFKRITWEQSEKIGKELQKLVARADDETLRFLLAEFQLQKIDSPDLTTALVALAKEKSALRPVIVDMAAHGHTASPKLLAFLEDVALDTQADKALRTKAFEGLNNADAPEKAFETLTIEVSRGDARMYSPIHPGEPVKALATPQEIAFSERLRDTFIHEGRHAAHADYFIKMSTSENPIESELAYAALLQISSARSGRQARAAVRDVIDAAWKSPRVPNFLRAIGIAKADTYASQVRSYLNDSRADIAAAAAYANNRLNSNASTSPAPPRKNTIGTMAYEEVMSEAIKIPGNPKAGAEFFDKLGCVKCHTVSKSEPLKGPFLGDIFARYKRPEIIESILRPNAQIAQGFTSNVIETKDGNEYDGFIVRESGDEVELRNLAGATVIPKKDIVKRGTRPTSIMPEGLADQIAPADLASLLAYLESLNPKS